MRQACLLVVCCHSLVSGQLEFIEPAEVNAIDNEITLGLTIVNIKRVKSITELFQVSAAKNVKNKCYSIWLFLIDI